MKKNYIIVTFCVLFACFFTTSLAAKMVSVTGDNVNLRNGPGTKYSVKWKYGSGFPLKILNQKGSWLQVEDFENDSGWIHKSLTSNAGYMIVKVNKGQNKKINIRSGPGTNYSVIGKAYYGVVFKTLDQQKGWAKVKHEDKNIVGWVKRSLLWGF